MEREIVRNGAVAIGLAGTIGVPDHGPLGLDGVCGGCAHLDGPGHDLLIEATRTHLALVVTAHGPHRAIFLVEGGVAAPTREGDDILNVGVDVAHGLIGIPHLLQGSGSVHRSIVGAILAGIVVQAQLTAGVQAPAQHLGGFGLGTGAVQLHSPLNQQAVHTAQSNALDVFHGHVAVSGGVHKAAALGSHIGKTLIHNLAPLGGSGLSVSRTSTGIDAAAHQDLVVVSQISSGRVARLHVQDLVQFAVIIHMVHIVVHRLIGNTSPDGVGINIGQRGAVGAPGHHSAVFTESLGVVGGRLNSDHVPQIALGSVEQTTMGHTRCGGSGGHLDGTGLIGRAVHIPQLMLGIVAPGPHGAVLGQSQGIVAGSGHGDHVVEILGGYSGHLGRYFNHLGNGLFLVLPKEVPVLILILLILGRNTRHSVLDNDHASGGTLGNTGNAQLANVVLAPCPDRTVGLERQGKVVAGGDVNDLIQDLDLAALHVGHLHGRGTVGGIADAQLAGIVLAPGPHGTIRLQAHVKVGARDHFGRGDLLFLLLRTRGVGDGDSILDHGNVDHTVLMGIVGGGIAHHLNENVGSAVAVMLSVHLHRADGDGRAVDRYSGHVLVGRPGQELGTLQSVGVGSVRFVLIKEQEAGHILQSGLGHIHPQTLTLMDGHIGLAVQPRDGGAADGHGIIQIEGVEILGTHTDGIVPVGGSIIAHGIGGVVETHAVVRPLEGTQLAGGIETHAVDTAVGTLNHGEIIAYRDSVDVVHILAVNVGEVIRHIGAGIIIGRLLDGLGSQNADHAAVGGHRLAQAHLVFGGIVRIDTEGVGNTVLTSHSVVVAIGIHAHRPVPAAGDLTGQEIVQTSLPAIVVVASGVYLVVPGNEQGRGAAHVNVGDGTDIHVVRTTGHAGILHHVGRNVGPLARGRGGSDAKLAVVILAGISHPGGRTSVAGQGLQAEGNHAAVGPQGHHGGAIDGHFHHPVKDPSLAGAAGGIGQNAAHVGHPLIDVMVIPAVDRGKIARRSVIVIECLPVVHMDDGAVIQQGQTHIQTGGHLDHLPSGGNRELAGIIVIFKIPIGSMLSTHMPGVVITQNPEPSLRIGGQGKVLPCGHRNHIGQGRVVPLHDLVGIAIVIGVVRYHTGAQDSGVVGAQNAPVVGAPTPESSVSLQCQGIAGATGNHGIDHDLLFVLDHADHHLAHVAGRGIVDRHHGPAVHTVAVGRDEATAAHGKEPLISRAQGQAGEALLHRLLGELIGIETLQVVVVDTGELDGLSLLHGKEEGLLLGAILLGRQEEVGIGILVSCPGHPVIAAQLTVRICVTPLTVVIGGTAYPDLSVISHIDTLRTIQNQMGHMVQGPAGIGDVVVTVIAGQKRSGCGKSTGGGDHIAAPNPGPAMVGTGGAAVVGQVGSQATGHR